jgi:signal transduction histidine kinase
MNGTEILLTLINDLLDMSRIQAGKFSLNPQPVRLKELARAAMTHLTGLAEQKRQGLYLDAEDDLPVVKADQQRVSQVILNLVGNAIKFTPEGGRIDVRLRHAPDGVRVEVKDNGIGIARADQLRLFHPFTQVDSSSTRAKGGTGLGLSISKALIEAHGGAIGVESAPGAGSTFWFTLPADQG